MIKITDKAQCCGCTACASICPKKAIVMEEDEEGFLYPLVDIEKCINCGICDKACQNINGYKKSATELAYAVRNKSVDILNNSTSGGAFYAFASNIVNRGGSVYGAIFGEGFEVVHSEINEKEKLEEFCGSKYVQSYLGNTFSEIKQKLKNGKFVLFSGTPCQVAGLNNYLSEEYDNLFTVEVICHGTPSPLLWKKYLEYQEKKYGSTPKSIAFRKKTYGYHSGTMEIVFESGKKYTGSARVDYMLKSFFSEIASRYSCYTCIHKGNERSADISIYDCWNANKLIENFTDDDKGYTNVLINTEKGKALFNAVKEDFEYYAVDRVKAIKYDGKMVFLQPLMNEYRNEYYKSLCETGLENTVKRYINVKKKDLIIEKSKKVFYKMGLFDKIKKINKK